MIGAAAGTDADAIYSRIARRIIPVLILLFVMAWMDRVNVGFARLQMLQDLGFSEAVFGFGAGIFYLGYLLFEIPEQPPARADRRAKDARADRAALGRRPASR